MIFFICLQFIKANCPIVFALSNSIFVSSVQFAKALFPIVVALGNSIFTSSVQPSKALSPIVVALGKIIVTSFLQLLNALIPTFTTSSPRIDSKFSNLSKIELLYPGIFVIFFLNITSLTVLNLSGFFLISSKSYGDDKINVSPLSLGFGTLEISTPFSFTMLVSLRA